MFLSHTSDLRSHPADRSFVRSAEAAVIRAGHAALDDAYFAPQAFPPADYCAMMVARCDVYVGIIGLRYGTVVSSRPSVSYVEHEFDIATALEIPRLVFLVEGDHLSARSTDEPSGDATRQEAFRQRLRTAGITIAQVDSPERLELLLYQALMELTDDMPRVAWSPTCPGGSGGCRSRPLAGSQTA